MITARTFKDKSEALKYAQVLVKQLREFSINDYSINTVDQSINSRNGEMEEVISDLVKLGYKGFVPSIWKLNPKLRRARFLSIEAKYPIMVRESRTGWGTTIVMMGKSLPRYRKAADAFRPFLEDEVELDVATIVPGTMSLQMNGRLKPNVDGDALLDTLTRNGFKAHGNMLLSQKLGLYLKIDDRVLSFIDSQY